MTKVNPRRGEIWYVDLDPTVGREQAKRRPCLVISVEQYNLSPADLVVVLPMTSKDKKIPWHVVVDVRQSGLKQTSFVMCDQIRTVSKERFHGKKLGFLSDLLLKAIETRLCILLDL